MKHIKLFEDFVFESELNELALTSAGVKGLLTAIYYNWDKIKDRLRNEMQFDKFKDIVYFIKTGGQAEQKELEDFIKTIGISIPDMDNIQNWDLR